MNYAIEFIADCKETHRLTRKALVPTHGAFSGSAVRAL